MYCAGCGSEINAGLNYCKNCGMRISNDEEGYISQRVLTTLVVTFGVVTVVGFGILIALIALLLDRGAPEKILGITIVFYLACLTAIEFVLGTQISKLINAGIKKDKTGKEQKNAPEYVQPAQLFARNTAQLDEPTQMPISVTDHTTRTLDKVSLKEN